MKINTHKTAQGARRAKGTGNLFERSGTWYARWTFRGETRKVSTGIRVGKGVKARGESRREAESVLMDLTAAVRIGKREDALAFVKRQIQTENERLADDMERMKRRMTVGDMADAFRTSPRRPDCGDGMLDFYCSVIGRFAEWAGAGMEVCRVGDNVAEEYAATLSGKAAGTFNKAINALSLVWRVLGPSAGLQDGTDPWKGIARKRGGAHVRRALTRDETDAMMAAAEGETRRLVAVCLFTGLRLADACRLRWEDIRDGVAYVVTAKRDRKVAVPIHPKLAEALGKPERRGFVMPEIARRYAASQGPSNVSRSLKRLMERCGIATSVRGANGRMVPDATAHSLRHTFVTRAIEAGIPPHIVQAIVGHASGTMTERYTHLSDETVMEAFRRMK